MNDYKESRVSSKDISAYVSIESKLHNEFWEQFIDIAFKDLEFKNIFNKRKSWEKSYYDLFWELNGVHLCLRHNIRDNYVAVEIYVEECKEMYKYLFDHKSDLEKLYGGVLNFVEIGKANKIYDRYNCGEIRDRDTWGKYILWLKNTALKMKFIIDKIIKESDDSDKFKYVKYSRKINKKLNNYIDDISDNALINEKLPYEREVISIPAVGTIDLIYNYRVHAHPNDSKRYPYKKALFYTFREKGGLMTKLYELNKIITLNPNNIDLINDLEIAKFLKERLKGYIEERKRTYTFDEDGEYKFYILNEPIDLINKVYLPKQNNHAYFTIKEIYSGNTIINRSNENTFNNRTNIFDIIKKNSSINYIELDNEDIDTTIIEGDIVSITKEVRKRNSLARRLKLEDFREKHGNIYCEVCGIDDELVLDVHHEKVKVADMKEKHITKLDDLRIVCANCHRKIHGLNITVDKLINIFLADKK